MAESPRSLQSLEELLGYRFRDRDLLQRAMTHASLEEEHNERLEFLGDAVLDLIVSEMLFRDFPDSREGELTEWKSLLVSRETLSRVGERLGLDRWLRSGGNLDQRGAVPISLLGNAVEALLGAIQLDCPAEEVLKVCQRLVREWLDHELQSLPERHARAQAKKHLQNWAQTNQGCTPAYKVVDSHEHPETQAFAVSVRIGSRHFPAAWGATKKEAERRAAWEAMLVLGVPR